MASPSTLFYFTSSLIFILHLRCTFLSYTATLKRTHDHTHNKTNTHQHTQTLTHTHIHNHTYKHKQTEVVCCSIEGRAVVQWLASALQTLDVTCSNPLWSDGTWAWHFTLIDTGSSYQWFELCFLNAENNFLCTYFMYK